MVFSDFWNPAQDVIKHSVALFFSELDRGVSVDGSVNKIKLSFINGIGNFIGQTFNDDINESVGFHFSVLDHFEEASPDQCSTQNVSDIMEVLFEVGQRDFIDDIFGEGMIFKVKEDGFVVVGAVIKSDVVSFWFDKGLDDIDGLVSFEQTDFDSVGSQGWMLFSVGGLNDSNFSLIALGFGVPESLNLVQ